MKLFSYILVASNIIRGGALRNLFGQGLSINDVGPEGEGGGTKKMTILGDFQSSTGVTRGGGSKNCEIGVTSFMDGPQGKIAIIL